ncbi:hypothetical protein [Streptomyces hiroshimensis]|uniref:DUF4386 family protein n=1 Tax=Streptomyces hiroshimensis TaxID=66424 RepID=A0ABQ2Y8D5_9ACTN|nr:hypothetical protein [Streptomyces hiroshimensis]GGX69128.1 hypothetical protein GCM10010324_12530 [Streptomyces hiroshimensis]
MTYDPRGRLRFGPLTRISLIGAPALIVVYGTIRLLSPRGVPGPGWTAGHLALLFGLALFGPVLVGLRRLAPEGAVARRRTAGAGTALALAGLAASLAQAAIDLVVGFRAEDGAEMAELFGRVQSHAAVKLAVYSLGPLLFYVGLLALVSSLISRHGPVSVRTLASIVLGIVVMGVSLDLMPAGGALFLLALAPLSRVRTAGPDGAPATGPDGGPAAEGNRFDSPALPRAGSPV